MKQGRKQSGFTLVELMVVIVLIGITTAVILPEMRGTYEGARLRATTRKLVNALNLAASRAAALNQLHRVRIDVARNRFAVERPAREGEAGFLPVRDVPGAEGDLDKRISVDLQGSEDGAADSAREKEQSLPEDELQRSRRREFIAFYPDGTADAGEILLRDTDGFRLLLRINPITSRLQVMELGRE